MTEAQKAREKELERLRVAKYEHTQRVIMIARRKRGMTIEDLADKLYVHPSTLQAWEGGRSKAPWDEIERVMPEVAEMREHGCLHYCEKVAQCQESGVCAFRKKGKPKKV